MAHCPILSFFFFFFFFFFEFCRFCFQSISWICPLLLVFTAAVVLSLLFLSGPARIVIAVVDAILALLLIWVLCCTYYTLGETALLLQCGPLHEEYPYEELKTVVRTRGYGFVMALAFDRLELNHGLNPERGRIVLSPEREDEFLEELARRCPEIQIK